MLGSLPIAGLAVLAAIIGVYILADRLVALIPERAAAAVMGSLFLVLGVWGVYAIVTGRSPSGTSRSARLLAFIVSLGLALLGLPLVAFALGLFGAPGGF